MTYLPVPGWEQYYLVSNEGDVLDLRRCKHLAMDSSRRPQVFLSHGPNNAGWRVNPGTLVLLAFVGPRPIGMECCHIDDDPTHNMLNNLRWGTRRSNMQDSRRNHGLPYLTEAAVKEARMLRAADPVTWTWRALRARFGICVRDAVRRKSWKDVA